MVAVPADIPVTVPVASIVATDGLLLDHAPPGEVVSDRWAVPPIQPKEGPLMGSAKEPSESNTAASVKSSDFFIKVFYYSKVKNITFKNRFHW